MYKDIGVIFLVLLGFYNALQAQKTVFDIARTGSVEELAALYEKFPDTINSVNQAGYAPLTLACYSGNNAVAIFIAARCQNIDSASKEGTPLMASVVKNNMVMVQKLIALNANLNRTDANGTSALHYAVLFGFDKIGELLVNAGASTVLRDAKGYTALDYAKQFNNTKFIKLLN